MFRKFIPCILVLFFVAGCGGGGETFETAEIFGEVKKMNGEPIGKVTVLFYPAKGASVVTKTDEAGAFRCQVPLGTAKVAIVEASEATSTDTSPSATETETPVATKINPRFADADSSAITVTVEKDQKEKAVIVVE